MEDDKQVTIDDWLEQVKAEIAKIEKENRIEAKKIFNKERK